MGTIPDDIGGIFAHLREAALTMQQGGGIGYDVSTLRPRVEAIAAAYRYTQLRLYERRRAHGPLVAPL
jgi:hypothetical protein